MPSKTGGDNESSHGVEVTSQQGVEEDPSPQDKEKLNPSVAVTSLMGGDHEPDMSLDIQEVPDSQPGDEKDVHQPIM